MTAKRDEMPTLLTMPSAMVSGGMYVTVPVVFVAILLWMSISRARPKSDTFAVKPWRIVDVDASRMLPARDSPCESQPTSVLDQLTDCEQGSTEDLVY